MGNVIKLTVKDLFKLATADLPCTYVHYEQVYFDSVIRIGLRWIYDNCISYALEMNSKNIHYQCILKLLF